MKNTRQDHAPAARWIVSAVFFMCGSFVGLWASRIPDIKAAAGLDESGFGMLLLVMACGAFAAFPLTGKLVDRKGAAPVTKVFTAATAGSFLLIGLTPSTPLLAPALFLGGFSFGALDVAMNGWGSEIEARLGRPLMNSFHGLFSLGAGAAAAAGGFAIEAGLSIPVHFGLWFALSVPLLARTALQRWHSEISAAGEKTRAPLFAVPKGALVFVGLIALVAALGEGAVTDWAALYQIVDLGYAGSIAPTAFTVFSVAMVIMRLSGDRIIARFGPVPVARVSGVVAFLGCLLFVSGVNIWIVWAGAFVMGLGYAVLFPIAMSRAASDPVMSKGAALAAVATLGYGAFLFGPPLLGFVGDLISLRASFLAVALLTVSLPFLAGALKVKP
ncbi:MFS transporter [Roseibium aggregatum]|uniref:MFS transporter n=1 Tax=Roseibium aggregatum TaxID=187304 RepID=A0A939EGJ9_9HYPH|nr:MFS transporter [Roseibium aggregatum]MBN9672336.1 MFS transporter [Roseibium aggregatum]